MPFLAHLQHTLRRVRKRRSAGHDALGQATRHSEKGVRVRRVPQDSRARRTAAFPTAVGQAGSAPSGRYHTAQGGYAERPPSVRLQPRAAAATAATTTAGERAAIPCM
jgi:hypothetical protein